MVIIMKTTASPEEIQRVEEEVTRFGFRPFINPGVERKVVALLGELNIEKADLVDHFSTFPGVERVALISQPYKLASRSYHPEQTVITVGPMTLGGKRFSVIAGPCSVESREQLLETARAVKAAGAHALRGGAFKPRTSPYSFQGLGRQGLELLAEARAETGLPVVTEVLDPHEIDLVAEFADMLQIGARNSQNFALLQQAGKRKHPVLLKRGPGVKIDDLLMSAEYMVYGGNYQVAICERGITTFEDSTRYTTDMNAVPVLKDKTHLPVVVDPSHATGDRKYVAAIARAALAAGADGLLIEVHPHPEQALSDGFQSLTPDEFSRLLDELRPIAEAVGRTL
ncbi:3-deoxy-7-phosphoheptulonate synthase [candidate division KD3-62 bacterium DG_56]|uniref:3-deoxy-7-phosphoheptulonate synthase n=1 Tax=candidate division KD3-62 bacterium DG_56 TaxID=1704032 RepID=A0A0S7XJL5_9BACT|nr:MAG: 3-deoxy-7-phosphoheptulonate synthase [candidate division KD3-62 bacterium DG_56]